MSNNNAINTGPIATLSQAVAGTDTTKLITPYTAYRTIVSRGLTVSTTNLGITTAGGLMTITAADQTALSASNYGTVQIPSKLFQGETNTYQITANQVLTISNLTNNLLGTTAGVAFANAIKLYFYAVQNDAEDGVIFMVSRIPSRVVSPTAANIGMPSTSVADSQGSFFAFSNVTAADYESNPCVLVGSFEATKSAAEVWSLNTVTRRVGIGKFWGAELRTYPTGQQGAAAGKYFRNNGGTAPSVGTANYQYYLRPDGTCMILVNLGSTTVGAGAVNAQMVLPFEPAYDNVAGVHTDLFLAGATNCYYPIIHTGPYMEFKKTSSGAFVLNTTNITNVAIMMMYQVSDA